MNAVTDRPVVLVTGGGRRIGRAISLAFGAAGYNVAVHWHRSGEAASDVAREVAQMGGLSRGFQADLSRPAAAPALAADVRAHFGRVDVLVNNASQFQPTPFLLSSQEELAEAAMAAFDLHVRSPLALIRALAPGMSARGAGSIVNVGDADTVRPGYVPYAAAKAALAAVTRGLARELAPRIRVNMVSPGAVLPPAGATDESVARLVERVPMGRLGEPDEVARAVVFLATGPAFLTGQVLSVDGAQY